MGAGPMEQALREILSSLPLPDGAAMEAARQRQARLAKPPHSLGRLEDLSVQLAGITGRLHNPVDVRRVLIFAADNGIADEGVSSCPRRVTLQQTINFTRGLTGVAVLAKHFHADLDVIDVGIDTDLPLPGVRNLKIARGTRNFAVEPAMTREQALRAVHVGIDAARRAVNDGVQIVGVGEMGVGNTTTSSAVLCALTGLDAESAVSRGAGLDDAGLARKKRLIDDALRRWQPDPADPIDVLSKVGGFDLAAMCGAFIGAASARVPAVIDGFISAVAALCACRLSPRCADVMIPSHASAEKGYALAMDAMGLKPMLQLDMRLGEGSGCPLAFEIVAASQSVLRDMATFDQAGIDDGYLDAIRDNPVFRGDAV